MLRERRRWVWLARTLPGALLVATLVDDPLFGGSIVAARLASGTSGLLTASAGFVLLSTAMAAMTAWSLRTEPIRLSPKNRHRLAALESRRFGRLLIPHPGRPATTAVAAIVFGSVAPIVVGALAPGGGRSFSTGMVLISGVAYGVAFATGYGLLGALVGAAT